MEQAPVDRNVADKVAAERYWKHRANVDAAMERYRKRIQHDAKKMEYIKQRNKEWMAEYREGIKNDPERLEKFRERARVYQRGYHARKREERKEGLKE